MTITTAEPLPGDHKHGPVNTATITRVDYAVLEGVILLRARCSGCGATVHHGGGYDITDVALGDRAGHCACDGYDLVDPDGLIEAAMPDLRAAYEAHQRQAARREAARARREATEALR
ncbi:UNVERIFIED_ORG: hypothetical protein E4P37_07935 [Bacillus sp. AZ43]